MGKIIELFPNDLQNVTGGSEAMEILHMQIRNLKEKGYSPEQFVAVYNISNKTRAKQILRRHWNCG